MDRESAMKITESTLVTRKTNTTFSEIDNELVMMDLEHGKFFGLNEVGSTIWNLIAEPITVKALCDKLQLEYKVDRQECEEHTKSFLLALEESNMLKLL